MNQVAKNQFTVLFKEALQRTAALFRLPQDFADDLLVEIHTPTASNGQWIPVDKVIDNIYLSEQRFYRIIDVGFFRHEHMWVGFVRVSGHAPGPFEDTLDPNDLGPFKALAPIAAASPRQDRSFC